MSFDHSQFTEFMQNFKSVTAEYPDFIKDFLTKLGVEWLNKTVFRTPVDTGNLREKWELSEVYKEGNYYIIVLSNPVEYASFVEYGHSQQPGRYVPAIGKRLVRDFVPGKFMAKLSREEVEREMQSRFDQEWVQWLNAKLGG